MQLTETTGGLLKLTMIHPSVKSYRFCVYLFLLLVVVFFFFFKYYLILYQFLYFIRLTGQGFSTCLSLSYCSRKKLYASSKAQNLVSSMDFHISYITCNSPGVWALIESVKTSCVYNRVYTFSSKYIQSSSSWSPSDSVNSLSSCMWTLHH